jgi:hypothetical protein
VLTSRSTVDPTFIQPTSSPPQSDNDVLHPPPWIPIYAIHPEPFSFFFTSRFTNTNKPHIPQTSSTSYQSLLFTCTSLLYTCSISYLSPTNRLPPYQPAQPSIYTHLIYHILHIFPTPTYPHIHQLSCRPTPTPPSTILLPKGPGLAPIRMYQPYSPRQL